MFSNSYQTYQGTSGGWDADEQFFSKGGFLAGATQEDDDTASKGGSTFVEKRHQEGTHIFPLKVGIILKSLQQYVNEQRIVFLDYHVTMFKLIGVVSDLRVDEDSEKWSFTLDDGTGKMPIEWLAHRLRDYTEIEPSPWMKDELARIKNRVYVRVCGDINLVGKSRPHVSAFIVSCLDIPEEIFYHDIHLCWIIARHEKEKAQKSNVPSTVSEFSPQHNPPSSSYPASMQPNISLYRNESFPFSRNPSSVVKLDPPSVPPSLKSVLVEILRNMASFKPTGLDVSELLIQLAGRGLNVSDTAIYAECKQLIYEGVVQQNSEGRFKLI